MRRPTALREFNALRRWRALGVHVPEPVYFSFEPITNRAILITRELVGYCGLKVHLAKALTEDSRQELITQLSHAFFKLHSAGYRHGALYPDHVFVAPRSIAFVDLEKAKKIPWLFANAMTDLARFLNYTEGLSRKEIEILLLPYERRSPGFTKRLLNYCARKPARVNFEARHAVVTR